MTLSLTSKPALSMAPPIQSLEDFLRPLHVDVPKVHSLARSLCTTFQSLAAESEDQFLPTPISDSVLRPKSGGEKGRYLAIDIGGTNLRVGFIELLGHSECSMDDEHSDGDVKKPSEPSERSSVLRHLEKSWPIGEQLKNNKPEDLFAWIGKCIAEVVKNGCQVWPGQLSDELALGVTFSFPMIQHTLSEALIMSMGKGFTITSNLDLGKQLLWGYDLSRTPDLPSIHITALVNDAVATLVSFAYQPLKYSRRKAAMALIVGTGCNATIPLALEKLHPNKRPSKVKVLDENSSGENLKIVVNTEWTIRGAAKPLHDLRFITPWDTKLDEEGSAPGFQPFEYMTSGRYLGELGRLIILDYFTNKLSIPVSSLPSKFLHQHGLTTSFLGNLGPHLSETEPDILKQLERELPGQDTARWNWTSETASAVLEIAKAIQIRAAGMVAAAIIALLGCAEELQFPYSGPLTSGHTRPDVDELMVGYTGGCIAHFQDYLSDCQAFLDQIIETEFGSEKTVKRVVLQPCHDGGIIGAGILAGTVQSISHDI